MINYQVLLVHFWYYLKCIWKYLFFCLSNWPKMTHRLEELIISLWPFPIDNPDQYNLSAICKYQVPLLESLMEARLKGEAQRIEIFIWEVQNVLCAAKCRNKYPLKRIKISNQGNEKDEFLSNIAQSSEDYDSNEKIQGIDFTILDTILLVLTDINLISQWIIKLKKTSQVPQLIQLIGGSNVKESYEKTKLAQIPITIETVHHLRAQRGTQIRKSGKNFQLQVFPNHILLYLIPNKKTSPLNSCLPLQSNEDHQPILFEWSNWENYDFFPYPISETALEIRFLSKECVILVECKNKNIRDFLCKFKDTKEQKNVINWKSIVAVADIKATKWIKKIEETPCIAYRFSQGVHSTGVNCTLNINLIGDICSNSNAFKSGQFHLLANREETGTLIIQMKLASLIDFNPVTNVNGNKQTFKLVLGGINEVKGEPEMWTIKLSCQSDLESIDQFYRLWVQRLTRSIDIERDHIYLETVLSIGGKKYPGALTFSNQNGSCCLECFTSQSSLRFVIIGYTRTTILDLYNKEGKIEKGIIDLPHSNAFRDAELFMKRFIMQNDPDLISHMALKWLKDDSNN
jgi:hypothetical protein